MSAAEQGSFLDRFEQERGALIAGIDAARAARLQDVPEETRLWLAVTPAWTRPMAEGAQLPVGEIGLDAVIRALEHDGLCRVDSGARNAETGAIEPRFWMPSLARSMTLTQTLSSPIGGFSRVAHTVADVGRRLNALPPAQVLPKLRRWAAIAQFAPNPVAMRQELERCVGDCIAQNRADEALTWIEAARPLADTLGGELPLIVGQQVRRLDLLFRRRDDRRYLNYFLPREGQLHAFEDLMNGPDSLWALHFVGGGGLGKTMFMRYLNGQWAEKRRATIARIDFDHINPEFPARAPALLLAHFAQELRLYDATRAALRAFVNFDARLDALHQRARGRSPLELSLTTSSDEFYDLLDAFADVLRQLPRPVVLALDTCEELAKARLRGAQLPENVAATFDIFEALHSRMPELRVVFCGRRPLAAAGHQWTLSDSSYPPRDYLRLHEIFGFSDGEARAYLESSEIQSDLVPHILAASAEAPVRIGFEGAAAAQTAPTQVHVPFMLSLYANWAREDRSLTGEKIREGETDVYVDMRVVGRVRRAALRDLLPVIAELGWFDRALLRAISSADDNEFEDALRELWEQDWINRPGGDLFEVKPSLRARLRRYFARTGISVSTEMRNGAIAHLSKLTLEAPLSELGIPHFDVLARLLAARPDEGYVWWDRVEQRFAEGAQWDWARQLMERLLSEEGALAESTVGEPTGRGGSLRPAVLAAYAGVLTRDGAIASLDQAINGAAAGAWCDPRPDGRLRLAERLAALRVIAARGRPQFLAAVRAFLATLRPLSGEPEQRERLASQWMAALEVIADELELNALPARTCREATDRVANNIASAAVSREITVTAFAIAARVARHDHDARAALDLWKRALRSARPLNGTTRQRWVDWYAPDDVGARARLEFARSAFPALADAATVLRLLAPHSINGDSIDADRLRSVVLRLRGIARPPDLQDFREFVSASASVAGEPRARAHEATIPLVAQYWQEEALAYGRIDNALEQLRVEFSEAERMPGSLSTLGAIESTRLRIARRARLRDEERIGSYENRRANWADVPSFIVEAAVAGLDARSYQERVSALVPPQLGVDPAEWAHRVWRAFPALDEREAAFLLERAASAEMLNHAHESTFAGVSCALDLEEANAIAKRFKRPLPNANLAKSLGGKSGDLVARFRERYPLAFEEAYRLLLRHNALADADVASLTATADRLGPRFAGQVAFEEGELLALRLPDCARSILNAGAVQYRAADDAVGQTLILACELLAAVRAGARLQWSGLADRLCQAYQRLPTSDTPSWEALDSLADAPSPALLDSLAPSSWRPWLVRIIAGLAWRKEWRRPGARCLAIGRWIDMNLSARAFGEVAVPPELKPWWDRLDPPNDGGALRVAPLRVVIRTVSTESYGGSAASVQVDVQYEFRESINFEGKLLSRGTYTELARAGFPTARKKLAMLQTIDVTEIELLVDTSAAQGCWEAVISDWLGRPPLDLQCVRSPSRRRGLRTAGVDWTVRQFIGLAGDQGRIGDAIDWSDLRLEHSIEFSVLTPREVYSLAKVRRSSPGLTVIHVVAMPIVTGHGDLGLSFGGADQNLAFTRVYREGLASSGEILRARDLVHVSTGDRGATLFVLQGPPSEIHRRLSFDRECAGHLRAIASEIAEAGAAGVIVIPPLPVRDSRACLRELGLAIARRRTSLREAATELGAAMKAAIAEGVIRDPDMRIEAAADICLLLSNLDS